MIIIVKDNKITAIDKELLKKLNATLENVSSVINVIELEISSLTNDTLALNDNYFKVSQTDLLSIENIKAFNLQETQKPEVDLGINLQETQKPEVDLGINLQETQKPEVDLGINLQETQKPEVDLGINLQETAKPEVTETQPIEFTLGEEIQKPQTPQIQQETEISINFEDEFSEIEQLMDLSKEEAQEELQKELQTASEELGIDIETITELKDELFEMLRAEKKNLFKAIKEKDYENIHKIAHKLKGAALNLRLTNLSLILKKIDELSKNKTDIHKIEYFADKFYKFLDKIEGHEIKHQKPKIPEEIKTLIIKTIEDYLQNQNERKFQKDKKYIEKLLNIKVNSIEDLQRIVKE